LYQFDTTNFTRPVSKSLSLENGDSQEFYNRVDDHDQGRKNKSANRVLPIALFTEMAERHSRSPSRFSPIKIQHDLS
jgi:hypothetical protein